MTSEQTVEEMTQSLTGFDEIAIAQRFGAEFSDLAQSNPLRLQRAVIFVAERRKHFATGNGFQDDEAYQTAMELPLSALETYFASGEDDPLGEDHAPDAE
jgi:hypothetical protein